MTGSGPALWRVLRPSAFDLRDFSGGWNIRDSPSEVAKNESPDCLNVSVDERGGVVKRLGYSKLSSYADANNKPGSCMIYSATVGSLVLQWGDTVYKVNTAFTTITSIRTFTTTDRVAMVDFNGKLVMLHPVDGVYTYDGTTVALVTAAVRGRCLAVWQNKVWAAGDDFNPSRVWWSNLGDPSTWTTASAWIDIRDKDSAIITCLGAGQGMDVAGRAGLLVYKAESTYRINSASTGAYTTLHLHAGAAGPTAVTDLNGLTVAVCKLGLYMTDGVNPPKEMSRKVGPLFRDDQLDFSNLSLAAASTKGDRMLFSLPRRVGGSSQATNNFTLEFSPTEGWIVPHSFGWGALAGLPSTSKLYGLTPSGCSIYEVLKGGSDNGAAIAARYQTPWIEPSGGGKCSFLKLRVASRGAFSVYVKTDYTLGQGLLRQAVAQSGGFTWNDPSVLWNTSTMIWGPLSYEGYQQFYGLGIGRAISLVISESSTLSALGPTLLSDGTAPEVGAFACYSLDTQFVPLGGA